MSTKFKNIHLAPENEEDDIYEGYDDFQLDELEDDPEFLRVVATQHGRNKRPPLPTTGMGQPLRALRTGIRLGTQVGGVRLSTGYATEGGSARPMTSTGAAGFNSGPKVPGVFDPLGQAGGSTSSKIPVPPLDPLPEDSPEEVIRQLEKKVNTLLEESAEAGSRGDNQVALDKAKEASRKERLLCKQREQASLTDQINLDLTYSVLFNLASQYHVNRLYNEALNTYLLIVKNKMFGSGGRLRLNMGNIYFEQKKYSLAIKNYRMALDQIPDTHRTIRFKILQNICVVYVRMGQYNDAINTYEHIHSEMKDRVDFRTAMNLLLCYHSLGDKEKLKRHFQRMTLISTGTEIDEDRYYPTDDDDPNQRLLIEAIKDDSLSKIEREEQRRAEQTILNAAKLIAPVIEGSFASGFDWCIEVVKSSRHSELSSELEITKALTFLRDGDIPRAIETLKECGRKDSKIAGTAATNLSFIYFLEGDISQAEKYADVAIQQDHYNPYALVNKGNCLFASQQYEKACDYYQEALSVEATCSEALFNLGLVYKKTGELHLALECFIKMQTIFNNLPQVIYHIADIYDKLDDFHQSTEWFLQLVTLIPTDPGVLQRLGEIYDNNSDRSQAFQYYYESFRYCPASIDVISWLGAYYMDSQFCDKAVHYFERAALIQPNQVNWQLMTASCYRKTGNYQLALRCYKDIHNKFPDNIDCLKFLVRLTSDLGLKEAQEYSILLRKAEKTLEAKKQREVSGGSKKSNVPSGGGKSRERGTVESLSAGSGDSGSSGGGRKVRQADPSYSDPLGQLQEHPRVTARIQQHDDDDFNDIELDDDLLPE